MSFVCDGCFETKDGERVGISTEATDAGGVSVLVAKRWQLCRSCGDAVFTRLDQPSPWTEGDFRTIVIEDDLLLHHAGGSTGYIS